VAKKSENNEESPVWTLTRVKEEKPSLRINIHGSIHTAFIMGDWGEGGQAEWALLKTVQGTNYRVTWEGVVIALNCNEPLYT
jgi:hypothetical protein